MENIIICLILIISVLTDLRNRKILNIVTLPAIFGGLIYYSIFSGFDGFLFSGKGFLVGLGLLFIPFVMGGIGAGDVKLLAAIGAWKGALFVLYTGLYAGVVGGIIAIVILLKRKELGFVLKNMFFSFVLLGSTKGSLEFHSKGENSVSFPFGVAIAAGVILTYLLEVTL